MVPVQGRFGRGRDIFQLKIVPNGGSNQESKSFVEQHQRRIFHYFVRSYDDWQIHIARRKYSKSILFDVSRAMKINEIILNAFCEIICHECMIFSDCSFGRKRISQSGLSS